MDFSNWQEFSYEEILRARAYILLKSGDPKLRAVLKTLCERDPVFFFTFFCYTKNPDKKPANLPFIPYPFQKDLIYWLRDHLDEKTDGLIEKSRQMGVTWTVMTFIFWAWLFRKDFVCVCGSRKEELVDKRDKEDTLFYKLDYNLRRIPKWLLPRKFYPTKDRRHLLLVNRERGSTIWGESSNEDFGRGGTVSMSFLDELTTWPEASASWSAVSEAAQCKICCSTAKPFTFCKTLRFSNQIEVKTIHWHLHPERDDKWYEKKKGTMSPENLAQEIDISWDVTGKGKVYEEFELCPIGSYSYNPKLPLYIAWDYGLDNDTAMVWAQKDLEKKLIYIIDTYHNSEKVIDFYVPFVTGKIPKKDERLYTNKEKRQIREHRRWKRARHFGDPSGKQRHQSSNKSVIEILTKYGIHVFTNEKARSFPARRDATKLLMRRLCVDEKNSYFIECIQQARYPQRRESSQATKPVTSPVHDFTCLAGDTKIRTLKGWISIKDLTKEKEIWLWAYSRDEKRLIPTIAHSARITGKNAPLLEIGLDNGNSIKCTSEHKFMLRDETWKEAQDLKIDDSLMPFYEYDNRDYVRVNLNDGSLTDEHLFVYYRFKGIPPLGYHIDHIDGDKRNNYPNNLQAISQADHCSKTFKGKSMKERRQMGKEKYPEVSSRKKIYRKCKYCGKEFLGDHRTFYCSKKCQQQNYKERNSRDERYKRDPSYKEKSKIIAKNFEENHKHSCVDCGKLCSRKAKRCRECANKDRRNNHRVRYIKKIEPEDVYDLTVPKYHNFIAEGVVVHNSHFRTALEYLSVNLKLDSSPPKRINYLKGKVKLDEDGKIHDDQKKKERKGKLIRYSFRSYQNG